MEYLYSWSKLQCLHELVIDYIHSNSQGNNWSKSGKQTWITERIKNGSGLNLLQGKIEDDRAHIILVA